MRGSRKRVHLTEVDLEPAEQKPMLRIAPAAASMIWLGSIALATAIYMEWLPARALFSEPRPARSERPRARVEAGERNRSRATPPSAQPLAARPRSAVTPPEPPESPVAQSQGDGPSPRESTVTTPSVVPESSRTIRGSYHSEDSNWAGGW